MFHPSLIPSIKFQFSKGVLPSLNSIHFLIKSFKLFFSPTFCFPSHSLISSSSTSCANTHFDSKFFFKYHLHQSVSHYFCEVGLIPTFSKFVSHFHKFPNQVYCMVIIILMLFCLMIITDFVRPKKMK